MTNAFHGAIDRLVRVLEAPERESYITDLCLMLRSSLFGHPANLQSLSAIPAPVRDDLFEFLRRDEDGDWPEGLDFDHFHMLIDR